MKRLLISLILFSVLATTAVAQRSYPLQINLKVGDSFSHLTKSSSPMLINSMGQTLEVKQDQTYYVTCKVIDVKDDQYLMEFNIDRILFYANSMGQEINFDTDAPDSSSPIANHFKKIVNIPVLCWMDKKLQRQGDYIVEEGVSTEQAEMVMNAMVIPRFYTGDPLALNQAMQLSVPPISIYSGLEKYQGSIVLVDMDEENCSFRGNSAIEATIEGTVVSGNSIENIVIDRKTGMLKKCFSTMSLKGEGTMQGVSMNMQSNSIISIQAL